MSNDKPAGIVLASLEYAGVTPVDNQTTANRIADGMAGAIGIFGDHPGGYLCGECLPKQLPEPTTMTASIKPEAPSFSIKNNGPEMGMG